MERLMKILYVACGAFILAGIIFMIFYAP